MYTLGWIPIRFTDPMPVERIRDSLYEAIDDPDIYYLEQDPHISMFGFEIPTRNLEHFENALEPLLTQLEGECVQVQDFHVYPSVDNPMVVCLDPQLDLEEVNNEAIDILERYDGNVRWGPTPAHITMFKGGTAGLEDRWGELNSDTHARLRAEIRKQKPSFTLTVDTISVET